MPKQRSTMTAADVRQMLRNNTLETVNRVEGRLVAKQSKPSSTAQEGQGGQVAENSTKTTSTNAPTPTAALSDAREDADAPVTVEEKGEEIIVPPNRPAGPNAPKVPNRR